MDVIILAGGKGTRLAELTRETPKGLVRIGDRPILWHIMQRYALFGHRRFIVCVGYEGRQIAEFFRQEAGQVGWEVVVSDAGVDATKSQRLKVALEHVHSDRFMVSYGDDLADVDLSAVEAHARQTASVVTLTAVRPLSPFGVMQLDEAGYVSGFREKCRIEEWINGGFMCASPELAPYLRLGELEQEVFAQLSEERRLNTYRHDGFWKAMNTHKDYLELNELSQRGLLSALIGARPRTTSPNPADSGARLHGDMLG